MKTPHNPGLANGRLAPPLKAKLVGHHESTGMHVKLEDWKNGWYGIELAISPPEIDRLITLLQKLKTDPKQHFHISSDYKGSGGLGDIEMFIKSDTDTDNLFLSSTALQPGDEI